MGLILLAGSLALILLPLSIAARASNGWATPHIVSPFAAILTLGSMVLMFARFLTPDRYAGRRLHDAPLLLCVGDQVR